jgi:type IV secretory pathway TrbD component
MNDLNLAQAFLGFVVVLWGLALLGGVLWIIGKCRKGPEIF